MIQQGCRACGDRVVVLHDSQNREVLAHATAPVDEGISVAELPGFLEDWDLWLDQRGVVHRLDVLPAALAVGVAASHYPSCARRPHWLGQRDAIGRLR